MEYNKSLLESWTGDFDGECPEGTDDQTAEIMWQDLVINHRIMKRIEYCKSLLAKHRDPFLCYVLARLYSFWDSGYCREVLEMRPVRYYCIMAIRIDRNYTLAWSFLSSVYWGLCVAEKAKNHLFDDDEDSTEETELFLRDIEKGGQDPQAFFRKNRRQQIRYIEKAIRCIRRALQTDPFNEKYHELQKCYFWERNEIYK